MTITLDLNPEIEKGLLSHAQARGMSLADYVQEIVSKEAGAPAQRAATAKTLLQFFRESPLVGLELEFERDKDSGRDIAL
jgi:hypothetical protein